MRPMKGGAMKCHCGCGGLVVAMNARFLHGHNRRKGNKTAERIAARIETYQGHWLWTGMMHSGGYGKLDGKLAHRVSWELEHGAVPDGLYIDHVCRERRCVNPAHLRLVTPRENSLENSTSSPAANAWKGRCKHGHAFNEDNTYWYGPGKRYRMCRTCRRNRMRGYARKERP